jgi:probable O-glycosylation ligase (exosortase A-associated)
MRDLIVVAIFGVSLIFALRNPFIGVLVFYWISFMNPHRYSWGFAYYLPLAMVAALVTFISAIFNFKQLKFPKTRETCLFLLLWIFITITTNFALYPDTAWRVWNTISKIFLMIVVTMLVVTTRERLLYFTLAIIAYVGFIGVKGAIFGVLTGGQYKIWGPPESYLSDNNDVGIAMVMLTPLCFLVKDMVKKKWQSYGLFGVGISSIISGVLTYSRGAFVGLAAMGFFYFLKARHKIIVAIAGLIIVGAGLNFLPPQWFDRMTTIQTYEMDRSAMQRINSWWFSFRLAQARALGGGFGCFTPEQYLIHSPNPDINVSESQAHTAHSIYFEVMATHGFGGLMIYLLCLISMLISLRQLDRIGRRLPNAGWISSFSRAFTVSILGFMVCGAFLSRAFYDLFWTIYAASVCLKSIVYSGNWIEMPESAVVSQHDDATNPEAARQAIDAESDVRSANGL